jgi:RNA polymerase sigma-70 factor, ECF subfamily
MQSLSFMNVPIPDRELLASIARGEKNAMQTLFARHQTRVFRFIARIVRNEAQAEELVNEVFLTVWQQAKRYEGNAAPTTWMLSIAHNKAVSSLRRRREERVDEDYVAQIADDADNAETLLQKDDKSTILRKCIDLLPEDQRLVMDLVYYQEQSVKETSVILGVPENTVKTRMFYARRKLAESLKAHGVDRGWP